MTKNLLVYAIENNEEDDFFRGRGRYHVPSPDYEGHVHGAHMGGYARSFAEESVENSIAFDEAFFSFVKSLTVSEEDVEHLLSNLSSYFSQKSRGGFSDSKIFEIPSTPGSILIKKYLEKISSSPVIEKVKSKIHVHAQFISGKGYSLLADIIKNLGVV